MLWITCALNVEIVASKNSALYLLIFKYKIHQLNYDSNEHIDAKIEKGIVFHFVLKFNFRSNAPVDTYL